MRRRTLLVAFGAFAACGQPYEGEIPTSDLPARDGGAETDSASAIDASEDTTPSSDAGDAGFDGDPCDRDRDGFREKSDACGGDDCDDDDDRVHPDAGFVREVPSAKTNGDWNCDGVVNRETPSANVTCNGLATLNCSGVAGFSGNAPACGASGTYVTCKVNGLACAVDTQTNLVQGCR